MTSAAITRMRAIFANLNISAVSCGAGLPVTRARQGFRVTAPDTDRTVGESASAGRAGSSLAALGAVFAGQRRSQSDAQTSKTQRWSYSTREQVGRNTVWSIHTGPKRSATVSDRACAG